MTNNFSNIPINESIHSRECGNLNNVQFEELLSNPFFLNLQSFGFIDEIAIRNFIIKSEYKKLRETQPQMEALFNLSEKYRLSFDTINTILFRKRPDRKIFLPAFN